MKTNLRFRSLLVLTLTIAGCTPVPAWAETFWASGYCPCYKCCLKTDGITASGRKATAGRTVALNWLPFHTKLTINGKPYSVEDRGAVSHFGNKKNKRKRLDIYFSTHKEALQFGKQQVNVEVLS